MIDKHNRLTGEEAANWYARLHAGNDPADRQRFTAWLNAAPQNAQAWEAIERTTDRIDDAAGHPAIAAMLADANAAVPLGNSLSRNGKRFRWLAMAASLLLVVGGAAAWKVQYGGKSASTTEGAHYATATGERKIVTLADGSQVTLDTDSAILVPEWADRRDVRLIKGQALFAVAKDAAHPFIVTSGDKSIRALGTRFTVRADDNRFSVALLEGRVQVGIPAADRHENILEAGDTLALEGRNLTIRHDEAPHAAGWVNGRLTFDTLPLRQIVAEMNRYSRRKIVLADDRLGDREFSGTFTLNGTDALLSALNAYHIARVVRADTQEVVLDME